MHTVFTFLACGFWILPVISSLPTGHSTAVVASEIHSITAKIGSDLRLPVPKSVEFWDLYAGDHHMGNYHLDFSALNGYEGRLEFSSETDIVILKKWTRADGLDFRFAVESLNGNDQITSYNVNYKVSVDEFVHGDTRNNTENAFTIFSLPSVLRALVIGIFCLYGGVADSLMKQISGQYGSDLHFPLSQLCQEKIFDIHGGETLIGNFHESFLQGFRGYNNRLQFDRKNCTFTLKNFSEADAHNFTFDGIEHKIRMDFEVHVPDTSEYTTKEYTTKEYTSKECTSGLLSLGFSMDPIICLIFIILAITVKKKRRTHAETVVSPTQKVVDFFLGKQDRNWINTACLSIKVFSPVFQIISLISLACCGDIYETKWFIAATSFTVMEVFFTGVWIYFAWKCDGGNVNLVKKYLARCCYVLGWAQSLAFPFCIYFLYFSVYTANVTLWALIAFPPVLVILKIGIFILWRWKKRNANTSEESTLDARGPL